jgi:hypothetical protein
MKTYFYDDAWLPIFIPVSGWSHFNVRVFLTDGLFDLSYRQNVMLTRAKEGLIVVGNKDTLQVFNNNICILSKMLVQHSFSPFLPARPSLGRLARLVE